jgi:phosphoribosylaminoimidazole-succinocarboxamide synthase
MTMAEEGNRACCWICHPELTCLQAFACGGVHEEYPEKGGTVIDSAEVMFESALEELPVFKRGKVRDIYVVNDAHLLIVATDRLSAFDVVLSDPIPRKGAVLTALSDFWFRKTVDIVPNHRSSIRLEDVVPTANERAPLNGRTMVVHRLDALPVEAIVRGYLIGSGWRDYQATAAVCGIDLPPDLPEAARLPEPIFTPSTKAPGAGHDENITFEQVIDLLGRDLATEMRSVSLRVYRQAAAQAEKQGIIIADTKLEFGINEYGRLYLIDEVLTPDSSRFWPAERYRPGSSPPSFDKQFVRDYLESVGWNKRPPAPRLPARVIEQTAAKYHEAKRRLIAE